MEAHQKNLAEDLSQNLSLCSEQVEMKELEDHYQDPLWKRNDQQLLSSKQHNTDTISTRGVPLHILISMIVCHLDRSKVRELQSHFTRLKRNEINKEDFMRFTRQIAGRQLLRMILANIQLQCSSEHQNFVSVDHQELKKHPERRHPLDMESILHGCEDKQFQRNGCSKEHQHTSKQRMYHGSHQQRQAEVLPEENPGFCSKEGSKHLHDPYKHLLHRMTTTEKPSSDMVLPSSVPLYLLIANVLPHIDKYKALELQAHYTKMKGNGISMEDFIRFTRQIVGRQLLQLALSKIQSQINSLPSSATVPLQAGLNVKTFSEEHSVSKKEPLEEPTSPRLFPSWLICRRKRKISAAVLDQAFGKLDNPSAFSEEEKQLLAEKRQKIWIPESAEKVVQEEESLLLQRIPLQKKLAEISRKCGITNINNNVERCLSMCVEKRMDELIRGLIRLSKMRVDFEKPKHQTFITSDVRFQILMINQKAKEVCMEREAENANKVVEDNRQTSANDFHQNVTQEVTRQSWQSMAEHPQRRREGRLRVETEMAQDNWLTKAANLAVRAAVGGDDMLLKWQLMAEHALLTREERLYKDSHAAKGASQAFSSTSIKLSQENWLPENQSSFSTYTAQNFSGSWPLQTKNVRSLSVRDVIADLERNPQMCKSIFICRLYEGMHASAVEGN